MAHDNGAGNTLHSNISFFLPGYWDNISCPWCHTACYCLSASQVCSIWKRLSRTFLTSRGKAEYGKSVAFPYRAQVSCAGSGRGSWGHKIIASLWSRAWLRGWGNRRWGCCEHPRRSWLLLWQRKTEPFRHTSTCPRACAAARLLLGTLLCPVPPPPAAQKGPRQQALAQTSGASALGAAPVLLGSGSGAS